MPVGVQNDTKSRAFLFGDRGLFSFPGVSGAAVLVRLSSGFDSLGDRHESPSDSFKG